MCDVRQRLVQLGVALTAVLLLSSCGGDREDADSPPPTASAPASDEASGGVPSRGNVWVQGGKLPDDYEGCMNGDALETLVTHDCEDGRRLASYDDKFWAFLGEEIHYAEGGTSTDPDYSEAFNC